MSDAALEMAEQSVLGAILHQPALAAEVFARVAISDFTGPRQLVAEAIHGLRVDRKPVEPGTVMGEMQRRGTASRLPHGAYVLDCVTAGVPATVAYHTQTIVDVVRRRRIYQLGVRAGQASERDGCDPLGLATSLRDGAQAVIDAAEADGEDVTTPTLGEFLAGEDAPYDWVIPGLMERGDRLILTGSEGAGKSVMFRQLAVATAAGVHPFTGQPMTPRRVLYVDVENGIAHLRRELRGLAVQARRQGAGADGDLFLEARPSGLDLTRAEDEAWLLKRVSTLQPALLLIGPLYKLHEADPNKEEPARKVAGVLDRCRAAANCALAVEAHAGHGQGVSGERHVRPTGTSLWLRWPEYGYGMRAAKDYDPLLRVVDLVPWRGDRSERSWPKRLIAGGAWPWSDFEEQGRWHGREAS